MRDLMANRVKGGVDTKPVQLLWPLAASTLTSLSFAFAVCLVCWPVCQRSVSDAWDRAAHYRCARLPSRPKLPEAGPAVATRLRSSGSASSLGSMRGGQCGHGQRSLFRPTWWRTDLGMMGLANTAGDRAVHPGTGPKDCDVKPGKRFHSHVWTSAGLRHAGRAVSSCAGSAGGVKAASARDWVKRRDPCAAPQF